MRARGAAAGVVTRRAAEEARREVTRAGDNRNITPTSALGNGAVSL